MPETLGTLFICCNVYPPRFIGGAELIAHHQALELQKLGWKVVVFTGDTKPQRNRHDMSHDVFEGLDVYRVYLTHLDYGSEFVNFSHPAVERHFQDLIGKYKPDVVHFHNIIGLSLRIVSLAKKAGARTVLTVHDHWGFCFKNTLMKTEGVACKDFTACRECLSSIEDGAGRRIPMRLRQDFFSLAMRKVDAFISPSAYLAKTYISAGFSQDRFHVVWNGIDLDRFRKMNRTPAPELLRLSFFGYFGRHKGIRSLLEALPLMKNKARVRVNLVGDGDQMKAYHEVLDANGCGKNVRFWGKLDNRDVEKAYAETDVLVLPSIWKENQPVSITEALAAGIPVIASRMGGIPELVEDGVNGFLFDAEDSRQIAAVVDRFFEDRGLLKRLGKNAAQRMARHGYVRQVREVMEIYRSPRHAEVSIPEAECLIICVGRRFSDIAFDAISGMQRSQGLPTLRFIHADWCDASDWESARICLVVDPKIELHDLNEGKARSLPLLVPEENSELANHVRAHGNGLYYGGVDDLIGCLGYLAENAISARQ